MSSTPIAGERSAPYPVQKYKGPYVVKNIPPNWHLAYTGARDGSQWYVPLGQTKDQWNETIIVRIFPGRKDDPKDALENKVPWTMQQECIGYLRTSVESGMQNGFPVATVVEYCGKHPSSGKGDVTVFKVSSGSEALLVVQRTLLVEPYDVNRPPISPEKWSEVKTWLNGVYVCDTTDPRRPCPPEYY